MSAVETTPPSGSESVRTPVLASLCPACGVIELRGRQQVCSAACRRKRSRQREADAARKRDAEIRALLEAALTKLREHP